MAVTKATGVHKIHSTFSTSGGVLSFYRDNASTQFAFGESDSGLDVKFFGDTASAWALWDESADTFLFASSAKLAVGGTFSVSGATTFSGETTFTGSVTISDKNITLSASTGTKIGTASTQKLGFWNATPVVQAAKVVSTGTASAMAISILNALENYGLLSATA